ncbi:MAG TPA: glycosyltransferase family 4 protein [Spongiibacteraceae bacterium]|nr:glycosyltransferase family 4 protein [Spongiibacteraceae bacterium]
MIGLLGYLTLSTALVGLYRRLALRNQWLDTPNARSSHRTTTPRGAGLVFVVLILGAGGWLLHPEYPLLGALGAGSLVALVGWWDDLRGISARVRFIFYSIAAATAVVLIFDSYGAALVGNHAPAASLVCGAVATLAVVWLINLYNFMDGINGIAAIEALFILLSIALFSIDTPYGHTFLQLHFASAAAIGGFLLWNFPGGKVFMGDVGSAFLGFYFGLLSLCSMALEGPSFAVWLILLGFFLVDSSYTLLVRMVTGQTWHAAHRLHAYQRLTDRLKGSHAHAVAVIMAVNLCWLLPMAWLVHKQWVGPIFGVSLAYTPLLAFCYRLKAGIPTQGGV